VGSSFGRQRGKSQPSENIVKREREGVEVICEGIFRLPFTLGGGREKESVLHYLKKTSFTRRYSFIISGQERGEKRRRTI